MTNSSSQHSSLHLSSCSAHWINFDIRIGREMVESIGARHVTFNTVKGPKTRSALRESQAMGARRTTSKILRAGRPYTPDTMDNSRGSRRRLDREPIITSGGIKDLFSQRVSSFLKWSHRRS